MHQHRSQTNPRNRLSDCPSGPTPMIVAQSRRVAPETDETPLQAPQSVSGVPETTATFAHFFRRQSNIVHNPRQQSEIRYKIPLIDVENRLIACPACPP